MWRLVSSFLRGVTIASARRSPSPLRSYHARKTDGDLMASSFSSLRFLWSSSTAFRITSPHFSPQPVSDALGNKRVEDVMPIATGHEREEIEFELEGKKRFDMDAPSGPFGTKALVLLLGCEFVDYTNLRYWIYDAPAIVQSYYNKRIVGCVGGEGEDEHDVVWFWLERDKPIECSVCSQHFKLEVIGEGGPVGDEDDDHDH